MPARLSRKDHMHLVQPAIPVCCRLSRIAAVVTDAYDGVELTRADVRAIVDDAPRRELPPRVEAAVLAEALIRRVPVAGVGGYAPEPEPVAA